MSQKRNFSRIKSGYARWKWRQATQVMSKLHELNYFFWEATLKCNLNCRHCGSDCSKNNDMYCLPAEKVIAVFNDIAMHYEAEKIMIAVTGGEPLMRADLFQVLSEVSKLGFPWGMVTNGMLVNSDIIRKCKETGMKSVSVSLDGLEATHNWLRENKDSYIKAINALKLFEDAGCFDIVEAITCVNPRNLNELEDVYTILQSLGIKKWRVISLFPQGRVQKADELKLNRDQLLELFEFIKNKRQSSSSMNVSYSEEGYLGCEWEGTVRDGYFFCGAGINVAGLLCDGSFSACPSLSRHWIQGHIEETSFTEAWKSRYANMRNREWMKSSQCASCKEWKNCKGTSLHLWDWENKIQKFCHFNTINKGGP